MDRNLGEELGPGTWHVLHTMTIFAKTVREQEAAADVINKVLRTYPCEVCREHAIQYLDSHPIDNAVGLLYGEIPAVFTWTWEFHNVVNQRTGKPVMSIDAAVEKYFTGAAVCRNCTKRTFNPIVSQYYPPNYRVIGH